MTTTVLDHIGVLVTNDAADAGGGDGALGMLTDAHVVFDGAAIVGVGTGRAPAADRRIDAGGRCVMPGFVDSHTHLVFAGDRSAEFASRMAGRPYEAGGINVTVGATRAASDATLRSLAAARRDEGRRAGITTIEIKSGYGLTAVDEAQVPPDRRRAHRRDDVPRCARRAARVHRSCRRLRRATCAARCSPRARRTPGGSTRSARRGAFDADQCRAVLDAGRAAGLGLRLHANQLGPGPGVALAVETGVRLRRPLHVPHRRRRRGAGGRIDRGDVPAGDRLLDPPAVPRRPARHRRRSRRSRSRPTATLARATRRRCRSASRSPCATCT